MTGENLMILLERRLDNVIFRLGFARTRDEARQIVDHKHVLVNGSCVNIPSYLIKAGDVISIKEKVQDSQRYKDIVAVTGSRMVPEWLEANIEALSGTVKQIPTRDDRCSGRRDADCRVVFQIIIIHCLAVTVLQSFAAYC